MDQTCIRRKGKHNTNYRYCIGNKNLPKDLVVDETKVLGMGRFGVVLQAKMDGNPLAIKIVPLDVPVPHEEDCGLITDLECQTLTRKLFDIEVEQSKLLSDQGITPKFYTSEVVDLSNFETNVDKNALTKPDKVGIIVMEQFGRSLKDWIQTNKNVFINNEENIKKKFFDLSKRIYELKYFNMDAHFGNILYDPYKDDVRLLDVVMDPIDPNDKLDDETFFGILEDIWENDRYAAMQKEKRKSRFS